MDRPITRHIDFLDPIRGIAILLVFLYHSLGVAFGSDQLPCGKWFSTFAVPRSFLPLIPVTFGWCGVPIFFVVSGFCIHLSFSRKPQWPHFFSRRLFRIYPPYLITLLFFAFLYPITRLHFPSQADTAQLVSHLVLLFNTSGKWVFGINPSWWSIAVEVQLYLLYPVVIFLTTRMGWRKALIGIAAIEIGQRLVDDSLLTSTGVGFPRWATDSPFYFWFSWTLGACVAELHIRGKTFDVSRISLCMVGTLAVVCRFVRPLFSMSFPLFALLTALIVIRLLRNPDEKLPLPEVLRSHLSKVGLCSFSLYLIHQPLLLTVPVLFGKLTSGAYIHPLGMFALCMGSWFVIVPIANAFYKLFELPSIAAGKRFYTSNALLER